jgi:thiamine pyrophosphokinase
LRIIIFANGWLGKPIPLRPDDRIIAADGGAHHCLALGVYPSVVIGDLDSLTSAELDTLRAHGAEIIQYPIRKEYTDLELALQYVRDLPGEQVIIVAALGARWDQTLANVLLPSVQPDRRISLYDGPQEIHFLANDELLEIEGHPGDTVSLLALCDEAHGVTTQALEYPLNDETLYFGSTRGVSNVMLTERAGVYLKNGRLMCTVIHQ